MLIKDAEILPLIYMYTHDSNILFIKLLLNKLKQNFLINRYIIII